jgi:predicted RNase H-like HicB family nuclease
MKGIKAERIKVKIGNLWESPLLHVLLTEEDDVIVARCLDFTVSTHGNDEDDALHSLAEAIKEYVLTAIEDKAIDTILDPAHSKYWRLFNELELKQSMSTFTQSFKQIVQPFSDEMIPQLRPEISYA